ncbi:hypothetical protein EIP86_004564 [Pleurotus ostreatoroseus]|nr:hypothetical protein EIP86_004564 [Pleurotus ostreatoroseus]
MDTPTPDAVRQPAPLLPSSSTLLQPSGGNPLGINLVREDDKTPTASTANLPQPAPPQLNIPRSPPHTHSPPPAPSSQTQPSSAPSLLQPTPVAGPSQPPQPALAPAGPGPVDTLPPSAPPPGGAPRERELSRLNTPLNPPSRPRTPRTKPRTPKPLTPQSAAAATFMSENAQRGAGAGSGRRTPDANRPLNVTDALGYLDAVKNQFQDKPDVYNHFLDIMKDFKSQLIDTPGVIERVSMLFHGNPALIQGFNTFLPPGYRIELSTDPRNMNTITVTTPMGVLTQPTNPYGAPIRLPRENMLPVFPHQPPFGTTAPPPILPVGLGPGSRPTTPLSHTHPLQPSAFVEAPRPFSPAMQGNAAATFLGQMSGTPLEKSTDFNRAMTFLNKIKTRFPNGQEVYKQFLEILQSYQKEQKPPRDKTPVYAQVSRLFKDAPDLMEEFRVFMPEMMGGYPIGSAQGLQGIMPLPTEPAQANWERPESPPPVAEKPKAPSRRRKRAADKEPAAPKASGGRATKKAKLAHDKPAMSSPKFAAYQPPSPQPVPSHLHPTANTVHQPQHQVPHHGAPTQPVNLVMNGMPSSQDELIFWDRIKKALEPMGTYDDFLKLLSLYSSEVIELQALVEQADHFLGDIGNGELLAQFKDLVGWDDRSQNPEFGPPDSIRTRAPDPQAPICPDDGQGPSYRRLPDYETKLACSGRDWLAWKVLNDEWISHPTWASEESGFIAHKKNSFEDTLHRSEEERHEYQTHIDAITRTIAVLEPLAARIEQMSPEERDAFKLGPNLGGDSPKIYFKIFKRVYGYHNAHEIVDIMQQNPALCVPVVLARLKSKNEEWRRLQREFNRTWREVEAKNFYKSLDYQGITFKQNDKKNITAKYFVQEIENVKAEQARTHEGAPAEQDGGKHHLEFEFKDMGVLHDVLKMVYSYLDHALAQSYSNAERRSIERFLRTFVPTLFNFNPHEFNAACASVQPGHENDLLEEGSDREDEDKEKDKAASGRHSVSGAHTNGVPANDLRNRLLETVQEGTTKRSAKTLRSLGSASPSSPSTSSKLTGLPDDAASHSEGRSNPGDVWIREIPLGTAEGSADAGDAPAKRRPFFAGTTFYTLLRLLQLLYTRFLTFKEIGLESFREKHASLRVNPVARTLGQEETNGPSVILEEVEKEICERSGMEDANILYIYFLDVCEKTFAGEMDQATFEEHMRWFFRTKAYLVFTLDKVITAIVKQLWHLLKRIRRKENVTLYDVVRYRREAERHVGSDDHLYKVDCDDDTRTMRIQLLSVNDPSTDEDSTAVGRWREYVATYVLKHPTEWTPGSKRKRGPLYLKRNLMDGESGKEDVESSLALNIRVSLGTYKIFYEAGREDFVFRRRTDEDERMLLGRAAAREDERRRRLDKLLR